MADEAGDHVSGGSGALRFLQLAFSAGLVTAGLCTAMLLDYAPDWETIAGLGTFYLFLLGPIFFGLIFGCLYIIARVMGGTRALILPSFLLGASLAAYGFFTNRPIDFFRRNMMDPAPASVRELRAYTRASFGEGRAYLFVFEIAPGDFGNLIAAKEFKPGGVVTALPTTLPENEEIGRPDKALLRYFPRQYRVHVGDEVFVADRAVMVVNPEHTRVQVYLDHWEHH